jgi:hypothetical protein
MPSRNAIGDHIQNHCSNKERAQPHIGPQPALSSPAELKLSFLCGQMLRRVRSIGGRLPLLSDVFVNQAASSLDRYLIASKLHDL